MKPTTPELVTACLGISEHFMALASKATSKRRRRYYALRQQDMLEVVERLNELEGAKDFTGLTDRLGKPILVGQVVHWSDGGEELSLAERILTRWDRIAVVQKAPDIQFRVIDSPHGGTKKAGDTFHFGSFIYTDTQNHLTVVANSIEDYNTKHCGNPAEAMAWVESKLKVAGNTGLKD